MTTVNEKDATPKVDGEPAEDDQIVEELKQPEDEERDTEVDDVWEEEEEILEMMSLMENDDEIGFIEQFIQTIYGMGKFYNHDETAMRKFRAGWLNKNQGRSFPMVS